MKIAVGGKAGSGKTAVAGTLARVMAARGQRVVAVDDDRNPTTMPSGKPSSGHGARPGSP